ncbi:MAG: hypothetical protein FJX02_03915 [Alphaproteobacteria bacterium]|nr:hypothetical protein [Alphaproteobacteria bacterium]
MKIASLIVGVIALSAVLGVATAWFAERRLAALSAPFITRDLGRVTEVEVTLLLGAAPIGPEGGPNVYLQHRLDAVAELWRAGRLRHVLVSGDGRDVAQDEPTAMRAGLEARGIPADRIHADVWGLRTRDSVLRARDVYGQRRLLIVSQRFHLDRAVWMARAEGIEAWGYEARDVERAYSLWTELRRYPSALRAWHDIWRRVPAVRRDPPVSIGRDAAG